MFMHIDGHTPGPLAVIPCQVACELFSLNLHINLFVMFRLGSGRLMH
jgi:hypothetical protein